MQKLKVVLQSTAGYVNELWGKGTPRTGMKRMAELAHRYGFPVTWSVNLMSAREMNEELTAWHQEFGDDVCLWLKPWDLAPVPEDRRRYSEFGLAIGANKELMQFGSYEQIRAAVEKELAGVEAALPWACPLRIGAGGDRSTTLVQVLEDLGFDGLWGYLWQHRNTDSLTDAGCPYNLFYASRNSFKCPANHPAKVVGAHWFSYDMTNTFHSRATSVFTNDPNDVLRAKICDGRQIDFWKRYFEIWLRNTRWNDFLYYMFHQEAHEMEYSDVCREYSPEQIENTALMMDEFFKHLAAQDIEVVTLPALIQAYKADFPETIPTYFFSEQVKIDRPVDYYDFDFFNRPKPPQHVEWPNSFFYYDRDCQLAFSFPHAAPIMNYNYSNQYATDLDHDYPEDPKPEVKVQVEKSKNQVKIQLNINSPKEMPYGAVIWDDWSHYELQLPYLPECQIIDEYLLFLRFCMKPGENIIRFELRKMLNSPQIEESRL